jgi:hypothetical protein
LARSILYVGVGDGTCRQRAEALRQLGHDVRHVRAGHPSGGWRFQAWRVGNKLGRPPDLIGANRNLLAELAREPADVVWIDKGREIAPRTLARARELAPAARLVHYSPDDQMNPGNQSTAWRAGVPLYDLHVTTKSYNVAELRALGARDVLFVDNAYDPATHRPIDLSPDDRRRYGADVGFVGQYERERAETMDRLAGEGIDVRVWGPSWDGFRPRSPRLVAHDTMLGGLEYAKAINAAKINLGFLRKVNRDLQTTRSIEIPACGGFLLAERTDEHLRLFEEGREAEFFSDFDELLRKCRHYLAHDDERARIAAAGRARCLAGGYSNAERLRAVLAHLGPG